MNAFPYLSLIIPAYNEARRLPDTLAALDAYLREVSWEWELLLVVEESRDGTLEIARKAAAKDPRVRVVAPGVQRGKGHAVRLGMLEARGAIRLFMDADLSVPLKEISRFLAYFEQHPQVGIVIGSRKHAGSEIVRKQSWLRQRMGEMFNYILRSITHLDLRDTQCGFKAFRSDAAQALFAQQTIDGFAFDVELLLLADHFGWKVAELPVQWINSPDSHVRILHDSAAMLRDALLIRRRVEQLPGAKRPE